MVTWSMTYMYYTDGVQCIWQMKVLQQLIIEPSARLETGGGVLPHSLGGGVPLGSQKSYPLLDQILWPSTTPKILNYSWFQSFVSNPVKQDPILDQFSTITRPSTRPNGWKTIPSTRPNGLKTIPSPVAHTCIANIYGSTPQAGDLNGLGPDFDSQWSTGSQLSHFTMLTTAANSQPLILGMILTTVVGRVVHLYTTGLNVLCFFNPLSPKHIIWLISELS